MSKYTVGARIYRIEWHNTELGPRPTMREYAVTAITPKGCYIDTGWNTKTWVSDRSRQYGLSPEEARQQAAIRAKWYEIHSKRALENAQARRRILADPTAVPGPVLLREGVDILRRAR